MKILTASQIREWDEYTIGHEPVSSLRLMERAAEACTVHIVRLYPKAKRVAVFCGKGNNGGDGLAIARMLLKKNFEVVVYILEFGHLGTPDFQANLNRLHQYNYHEIHYIQSKSQLPALAPGTLIIDALFGTGLNRPLEGLAAALAEHINQSGCEVVSVDIPSGMFADTSCKNFPMVKATHTLSFQCYKPAFLMSENKDALGTVHLLDIGLHPDFYRTLQTEFELTDNEIIRGIYKKRNRFSHKGDFGHALLIAGSRGKMGAAILAAKACFRSGVGLLTCHVPRCGYEILQTAVPEAMVSDDASDDYISCLPDDTGRYDVLGIGPGLGTAKETAQMLFALLTGFRKPVVIDADALNILSTEKNNLSLIPKQSVLTPHPREFERLAGTSANDYERIHKAKEFSARLQCIIVLKGHHTFIASPDGKGYFNATGNAGMATAGSGDVLTGIITSLLAQGYSSFASAVLGVYVHGLAGDLAAADLSEEGLTASDIAFYTAKAFAKIAE
ncbi:MAG: NAD(P)H-hydrate dehydratase [Chitinophagaceae bacterium]|nr:NAD(P)H-hydrate dehydratase [Chitinophagaceae bacterium]